MKKDPANTSKAALTITGRIALWERQSLESKAAELGYVYGGKGSIFRLLRAIARGEIVLVRPAKTVK